jgi:DNA replication and repair protein RecF
VLVELRARNFRNLEDLTWRPAAGRQLLLGDNGSGKTSLLEAVYLAATTRSFRTTQPAECVRHGESGFELAAEVDAERRARLAVSFVGGRRERGVNGRAATLAEHLGVLPVLAWTAADGELLTGAPALRRRFLDRFVVGERPAAVDLLARYGRALLQKRELLAAGGNGALEAWNALLADAAAELTALRAAAVERLETALVGVLEASQLAFPEISLAYRPSPAEALAGRAAIAERLEALAGAERRRQAPLVGPHRDELEIRWGGHEVKRVASAGERKALALLLLAAQAEILRRGGREPLLLLDDADTELDRQALERVWRALPAGAQLLASSHRPEAWEGLAVEGRFALERGRVAPA